MSISLTFIGDGHGKFLTLEHLLSSNDFSTPPFILGDVGIGFSELKDRFFKEDIIAPYSPIFIRGNHDNPKVISSLKGYVDSGTIFEHGPLKSMTLGGAWSIDGPGCPWDWGRVPGLDWWENEEHSLSELQDLLKIYETVKPDIMITHDFPDSVIKALFKYEVHYENRTSNILAKMLSFHAPKLWLGGHHHVSVDETINKTRFICLNELEYATINISPKGLITREPN